ncbi:MAG: CDP-alcohol phosphatidyltransferase family protein [Deltaproteobacteria bacterium]|nr:CDP-alcohol phosphatidyltransferase family protein [Deltaproteobacteria bacterium]
MENLNSFERSLKPRAVEEFLDYYFYRRVAHRMVPVLIRMRLSPNQVTSLSLAAGLVAAWFALQSHFFASAFFSLFAIFLDCSDGQIARLTGKSSHLGHILDGFCDMLWITALWFAIHLSGYFQKSGFEWMLGVMSAAAASMFLHCWRFDGVKNFILKWSGNKAADNPLTLADYRKLFSRSLKEQKWGEATLCAIMLFQLFFFVWESHGEKIVSLSPGKRDLLRETMEPVLSGWSWIGEGHHNTVVMAGLFLAPLSPYPLIVSFLVILLPMNLWYLYCEARWRNSLKGLRKKGVEV